MLFKKPDQIVEPLYALVPVHNVWRWRTRWKLAERALKHFHDSGVTIVLVEIAFNRRELAFADSGLEGTPTNCGSILGSDSRFRHKYIGLHSRSELWLKENAINLGVAQLPDDWQQVCWLDSDILFTRPNWVGECIHKLQHGSEHDIAFLQMFSHARDLAPDYEVLPHTYPHADGPGFIQAWKDGKIKVTKRLDPVIEHDLNKLRKDAEATVRADDIQERLRDLEAVIADERKLNLDLNPYPYPPRVFPGLAWACTRKAWDAVGGLPDFAVWGGADHHMSHALIGKRDGMMRGDLHSNYQSLVNEWYDRCERYVRKNVLVMSGSVLHHWHGRKSERGYNAKHSLLARIGFDPLRHLKRDSSGLWNLHDDGTEAFTQLRDMMRVIAFDRNEDANEAFIPEVQGH